MENKMKIEIWSDVMCPFCYIGKRNFETALSKFENQNDIEVIWKSFQLNPALPFTPNEDYQEYLVKHKGISREQVNEMLTNVTRSAKDVGLDYNFDKAVMVNSMNAHKLIQFAKTKNLGDEAEERLFLAFFTEGKNIADLDTLMNLGLEIGLDKNELNTALSSKEFADKVKNDIQEAQQLGIQGVPFFVLNRKYGVSGAQPPQVILESLEKSFGEWQESNSGSIINLNKGQSCSPDGDCE